MFFYLLYVVIWFVLFFVFFILVGCTERLIIFVIFEGAFSVSNVNIYVASERVIRREGSIIYFISEIFRFYVSFYVSFKYVRRYKFFFIGDVFVRFFFCKKLKNNKFKLGFEKSIV